MLEHAYINKVKLTSIPRAYKGFRKGPNLIILKQLDISFERRYPVRLQSKTVLHSQGP